MEFLLLQITDRQILLGLKMQMTYVIIINHRRNPGINCCVMRALVGGAGSSLSQLYFAISAD